MLRVLIADDEAVARRYLLRLVETSQIETEVVGLAVDGGEAVEQAAALRPDLVLLDVRMPGMTGIEAARAIRGQVPSCAVILISAYREFEFAREGMESGARRYLVKPVEPERLQEALAEVAHQKEQERAEAERRAVLLRRLEEARPMMETAFATDLIHANLGSRETAEEIAGYLGKGLPNQVFFVDVDEFRRKTEDLPELERQVLMYQLREAVEKAFHSFGLEPSGWLMAPTGRDSLVVLVQNPSPAGPAEYEWAIGLGRAICAESARAVGIKVTVGIGGKREDPLLLWASYQEASTAERFKILAGKGRPIHYADLAGSPAPGRESLLAVEEKMTAAVRTGDPQEARRQAGELVALLTRELGLGEEVSLATASSYLAEVLAVLTRQLRRGEEDAPALWALKCRHVQAFSAADSPEHLAEVLRQAIADFTDFSEYTRWARTKPGIEAALRYIQANYAREITLADVARAVHHSQFYLTRLIKESTGMSFIRYLTKMRIERACELLRTTRMSIAEVARAVGYQNETYFSRVFKRETGFSPRRFR